MKWLLLLFAVGSYAVAQEPSRPVVIKPSALNEFESLTVERKTLVSTALSVAESNEWIRYKFGGSTPANKGFDCSGAMHFVLKSLNYEIPRSSSDQYLWLKTNDSITLISANVTSIQDSAFKALLPGDLLFWSGTYTPTDGRMTKITHVGMYLGTEKKDGRAVMICSSKGRSYRGEARDGYGLFDFKLPRPTSKANFVGFGKPPSPLQKPPGGE